jgi:hypothetical protein
MEEHDAGVEVAATIAAEGSPSPTPASAVLWSRSWTLVVCFQWWARRLCVETQKDRAKTHFWVLPQPGHKMGCRFASSVGARFD